MDPRGRAGRPAVGNNAEHASRMRRQVVYKDHDSFETPPSGAGLWRYVDFTKFVSLLEKQALFSDF